METRSYREDWCLKYLRSRKKKSCLLLQTSARDKCIGYSIYYSHIHVTLIMIIYLMLGNIKRHYIINLATLHCHYLTCHYLIFFP